MADRMHLRRQKRRRETDDMAALQPHHASAPAQQVSVHGDENEAALSVPAAALDRQQLGYDFTHLPSQPKELLHTAPARMIQRNKRTAKQAKQQPQHQNGIDAVVPIVFPDYKIQTPIGRISELGHAGVLIIEGKTGTTKYFEYGRYDAANLGLVRQRTIPNVQFGPDGRPTQRSMSRVMRSISVQAGHGGRIEASYILAPGQYPTMLGYANNRKAQNGNPERTPYELFDNNCIHFAKQVAEAGAVETPTIIDPRPVAYIEKLRNDYPDLNYDPRTRAAAYAQ